METNSLRRFRRNIDTAIQILIEKDGVASDDEILTALVSQMEHNDAIKIFTFLPIAFCRHLLPNFNWLDEYYESNRAKNEQTLMRFSENESYKAVSESVSRYFSFKANKLNILKIAGRSSEFHVINDILNKGGKLEDISLTAMCIIW